jgi:hypothetical protein
MLWALVILGIDALGLVLFWWRLSWRKLEGKGWAMTLGLVAGSLACLLTYSYSGRYRAVGFPLPGAVFDGRGLDYVNPLTPAILVIDFLLVGALPWSLLVLLGVLLRGRNGGGGLV